MWTSVTYVVAKGVGHDLPYGCILDTASSPNTIMYWNENGVAMSADPDIRQVCKDNVDLYEGKCSLILA